MEKLVRTVLAVFFLLGIATAQSNPRVTVFGGMSYLSYDNAQNTSSTGVPSNRLNMIGFDASAAFHIWHRFSAEADFGYQLKSNCPNTINEGTCSNYSFMGGPRYAFGSGSGRLTTFVHGLIGDDKANLPYTANQGANGNIVQGDSSFAVAAGGGANYWLFRHIGFGAEGDWFYTHHLSTYNLPSQTTSFRASAGLVFRFGGETSGGRREPRSRREISSSRPWSKSRAVPAGSQPSTEAARQPVQSLAGTPGHGMLIASLGAAVVPQEFDGAKIVEILPSSIAEMASLKVGDLIKSVDGKAVKTPMELLAELSDKSGKVRIGIQRGDLATETLILIGGR
jgi:hypothetical protein